MITLDELIKNEMVLGLEHEPTQAELDSVYAWLTTRDIKYFVNLDLEFIKWRDVATVPCDYCGHRYLPSEMINTVNEHFCSDKCKANWKEEHGGLRRLDEKKKQRRKHPRQLDLEQWIKDKENELA